MSKLEEIIILAFVGFHEQKIILGISLPASPAIEEPVLVETTDKYQTYLEERQGLIWQKRVYIDGRVEQSDNAIAGPEFNANGGLKLPNGRRLLWHYQVALQEQQA